MASVLTMLNALQGEETRLVHQKDTVENRLRAVKIQQSTLHYVHHIVSSGYTTLTEEEALTAVQHVTVTATPLKSRDAFTPDQSLVGRCVNGFLTAVRDGDYHTLFHDGWGEQPNLPADIPTWGLSRWGRLSEFDTHLNPWFTFTIRVNSRIIRSAQTPKMLGFLLRTHAATLEEYGRFLTSSVHLFDSLPFPMVDDGTFR